MSHYRKVVIQTYAHSGGRSKSSVRAKPLPGQGFSENMNVECSSKMRKGHPIGTKFALEAKLTSREGGTSFLYAHYKVPYTVVSDEEATAIIAQVSSNS